MATSIRMDGSPTPNESYLVGGTVSLSNADDTGVSSWLWTLEAIPNGSAAALSSPTVQFPTFGVDLEGTYRISLSTNGGPKDYAAARVLTQNIGLKALAHDETFEGDSTEGWAKPWRESYLTIDKAIGLSERRTVVYVSEFGTNTGPRVLEAYGQTTLANGDVVPVVREAVALTGEPPQYAGHGLYLYDDTNVSLQNNGQYSVLVKGLSKAIPADHDPSIEGGGNGLPTYNTGPSVQNQNIFLGSYDGIIYNENDVGPYTLYGDNQVYLGFAINPQFDTDIYIWWNPVSGVPADTHGFLSGDGSTVVSGRSYHANATNGSAGFMSAEDKKKLTDIPSGSVIRFGENLLDNSAFDFWQRGSGSYGMTNFPLSESINYLDFVSHPSRSYTADRWYASARNNDALSASIHDVSGTWSQGRTDTINPFQDHPYCMRVTNKSQNVAASGSTFTQGVGIQYHVMQDFDERTVRELIINKEHSLYVRIRGGTDFNFGAAIFAEIVATNVLNPGPLPNYYTDAPYRAQQFVTVGYAINNGGDWQDVFIPAFSFIGQFPTDVTAAGFSIFSEHPSGSDSQFGFGTDYDYWEVSKIALVTGSSFPNGVPFSLKGGTPEGELANCRKWFEKSYPLDVKPGTPNALGAKRGMVTLAGEHIVPEVRFEVPKNTVTSSFFGASSVLQVGLYDTVSGSSNAIFVSGAAGLITGSVFLTSSVGFSVHLSSSQTFGRETRFHYTASVDI